MAVETAAYKTLQTFTTIKALILKTTNETAGIAATSAATIKTLNSYRQTPTFSTMKMRISVGVKIIDWILVTTRICLQQQLLIAKAPTTAATTNTASKNITAVRTC